MKKQKIYLIDNEKLMLEWDYELNNELGLNPKILVIGSAK